MDQSLIAKKDDSLLKALEKLNQNTKGILFIVDDAQKLCGIVTDGDVRRALLKGAKLEDTIEVNMSTDYVFAYDDDSKNTILEKFDYRIKMVPIINRDRKIVDYFEYHTGIRVPVAEPYLKGNEFKYAMDALLSTWISSNGKYIKEFEDEFSAYCGCKYGVATSNGTTALHLALLALGIGHGDEVIVPDLTFAATINTVLHAGATPVIVDVEKDSWCIDPRAIERAITPKTKAVVPVHLYGQPCVMDKIMRIAHNHNLYIIEDCAEAHGAEFDGQKVGSFGDIGCFSFFGNKVITTGEGGMCITNDEKLMGKMRVFKDHGMSKTKKYWHDVVGYNYRMTNIQAAIGVAQLEKIDMLLEKRNNVEIMYNEILGDVSNIELQKRDFVKRKKITWLVSALVESGKRDKVLEVLKENGIDVRPFFYPLSHMDIYKKYAKDKLKNSAVISSSGLNLPTTIDLDRKVIDKVKDVLKCIL